MDQATRWAGLLELIKPYYSKTGRGRNPYPLETLRCMYPLQKQFSLSAPAMKGGAVRDHVSTSGITLNATIPEDTIIINFRHLLEKHQLAPAILVVINGYF